MEYINYMRRKEKYIVNSALIFGGVMAFTDFLLQWLDKKGNDEKLTWKNLDKQRILKSSLFGIAVGAGLGYLYYNQKIRDEKTGFGSNHVDKLIRKYDEVFLIKIADESTYSKFMERFASFDEKFSYPIN